jgi:F-box-like
LLKPFMIFEFSSILQKTFAHCIDKPAIDISFQKTSSTHFCEIDAFDSNILVTIFSFLNYKRLLQMRIVCKIFMDVADCDKLWQYLYAKKFKYPEDAESLKEINDIHCWKNCFKNRLIAEQEFWSSCKSIPNGFTKRLCSHINCFKVLSSAKALECHKRVNHKIKDLNIN